MTWRKVLGDYPADTWTLTYYLRSGTDGDEETLTATADGQDHLVSEAAATTAGWVAGTYYWSAIVSSGASRHTICTGSLKIKSNPAVTTTTDDRTDAKIILDSLVTAFKTRATRPEKKYTIQAAGRTFEFHTHEEFRREIAYWKSVVANEEAQAKADKGENTGNRILIRFK